MENTDRCVNCKRTVDTGHHLTLKGNIICNSCYSDTQKSKETAPTKMLSFQNGRGLCEISGEEEGK